MMHELKTHLPYYTRIADGTKPFEVRKADRPFCLGDWLHLRAWNPETKEYYGHSIRVQVTYILTDDFPGVTKGYVIMGLDLPGMVFLGYKAI